MNKRLLPLGALLLVACSSTPPQRHEYSLTLDALPAPRGAGVEKTELLNIRRIDLPAFLQTRALAMQVDRNEVVLARHHAWTDRLDDSIARVLALAIVNERPQLEIREATDVTCQLDVRFDRFHATDDGAVLASGNYTLVAHGVTTSREFDVSRPLPESGYAEAVSQLRIALNDFASEIVTAIETADGCEAAAERPETLRE